MKIWGCIMEMAYRRFLNFCFSCPRHRKALCWSTATPACPGHRLWSLATWCHVMVSHLMVPFHWWNQLTQPQHLTTVFWNNWRASNLKPPMDPNTKQQRENIKPGFWWKNLAVIVIWYWRKTSSLYYIQLNNFSFTNLVWIIIREEKGGKMA